LQQVIAPVVELCTHYGCAPWQLTPRDLDQYFAGPGKRGHSTIRAKLVDLDGYFAFLEQRYGGEILRRFGVAVESPVDRFNRPHHRGDFGIRIPRLAAQCANSSVPGATTSATHASTRSPFATT
jgi:hypothetical protein